MFYFGGRWRSHGYDSAQSGGVIGYASLPVDRFCAIEGIDGEFVTPPMRWPGGELALNADTRGGEFRSHPMHLEGSIEVEVQDARGQPLRGFSDTVKAVLRDNTHCRGRIHDGLVKWKDPTSMNRLRDCVIRLRFRLIHARLFSFAAASVGKDR